MQAHEFTKFVSSSDRDGKGHTFGVNREATAQALRDLADRIERREVLPQSAKVVTHARNDDWTYTYVRLVFAEMVAKDVDGTVRIRHAKESGESASSLAATNQELKASRIFADQLPGPMRSPEASVDKSETILCDSDKADL